MKLEQIDIDALLQVQEESKLIITELGQISMQEIAIKDRKEMALKFLNNLRQKEQTIAKELEDKYGKGRVNIATGEFIPD